MQERRLCATRPSRDGDMFALVNQVGTMRAFLGTGGPQRSAATPDIPAVFESGLTEFEAIRWWGVLALLKTPRGLVNLLNREIRAVLDVAEVRRSLVEQGTDSAGGTPEQFGALIEADMENWGEIGIRLGVKLD